MQKNPAKQKKARASNPSTNLATKHNIFKSQEETAVQHAAGLESAGPARAGEEEDDDDEPPQRSGDDARSCFRSTSDRNQERVKYFVRYETLFDVWAAADAATAAACLGALPPSQHKGRNMINQPMHNRFIHFTIDRSTNQSVN